MHDDMLMMDILATTVISKRKMLSFLNLLHVSPSMEIIFLSKIMKFFLSDGR